DVGARLFKDDQQNRRVHVSPAAGAIVLDPFDDVAERVQAHRHVMLLGNDERLIAVGIEQLIVAAEMVSVTLALKTSFGRIHIRLLQEQANLLEAQSSRSEDAGINLHANSRFSGAADKDLADAFDLAKAL